MQPDHHGVAAVDDDLPAALPAQPGPGEVDPEEQVVRSAAGTRVADCRTPQKRPDSTDVPGSRHLTSSTAGTASGSGCHREQAASAQRLRNA